MGSVDMKTPSLGVSQRIEIEEGSPLGAQACSPPFKAPKPAGGLRGGKQGGPPIFSMNPAGVRNNPITLHPPIANSPASLLPV